MHENYSKIRSDLAEELISRPRKKVDELVLRTAVKLDGHDAKRIGKPEGRYISFQSPVVTEGLENAYPRLSSAIAKDLTFFLKCADKTLVVGLGNPKLTSDALGQATVDRIITGERVCSLCPLVSGLTGIESFDLVRAVVSEVKPTAVIAIDALCAAERARLATVFQLTDTGIAPGSGVGNFRGWLNRETLGVPVLSLGVPLVVYLSTLISEADGDLNKTDRELIVTPKEVDMLVEGCAAVLSGAINSALA